MAFSKMDKNGDGQLTIEELSAGLEDCPEINIKAGDLENALEIIDSNKNGLIDYTEFIAACLHS
jgi:Ca2+-binding EF-hand superfamily protein